MKTYPLDINGFKTELPILPLPSGIEICFFNLHGDVALTEHCGKELAKHLADCDVVLTAESKGLQLSHVIARELGHPYYAVARKSKKLYMQDGIEVHYGSSITTGKDQSLYLSKHDVDLLAGKKVAVVDDVVSTGASLLGLEELVKKAGGIIHKKAFVLAEGSAAKRDDVIYLAAIPIIIPEK
jgi:adenine phosphoribosyltransferase